MLSAALIVSSGSSAYMQAKPLAPKVVPARSGVQMAAETDGWKAAGLAAALALATGVQSASAGPFTRSEIASLTYEQIKGTGLANTCPKVEVVGSPDQSIKIGSGKKYKIEEFCLEPTSFQVLEEKLTKGGLITEAVDTKVTTRQTYVLTGIEGDLVSDGGKLAFIEQDGIDYAATTVQLPGGERVPFLFTVKNLVAKTDTATDSISTKTKFAGGFKVPSYRTGLFLDPKGRGTTTGYDQAVALPAMQAGGDEGMFKENNKKFEVLDGSIEFKVTAVNAELGEFGGVFVQKQPSDTDLGSKVPKELLLKGAFFATVTEP
jgi:photosystem II oxygen-evolving enhancer protein 1